MAQFINFATGCCVISEALMMFTFSKDKKGIVSNLKFQKPLEHSFIPNSWEVVHERVAAEYAQKPWKYMTAIVRTEELAEKLWENPKHVHSSYDVWCSEVEERARKQAKVTPDLVDAIYERKKYPTERYNWKDEDSEGSFKTVPLQTEIRDAIIDAQVKMLYPVIIEEFKEECRYDYDEKADEEIKLSPRAFAKKWKEREAEIFLPRVHERAERALPNTPQPFTHRCYSAQYFFIEKENVVEWAFGSHIGSQTRYTHGLMGHVFALLTKKHHKTIPTYAFKNTKNNDFQYVKEWKTLKVDRHELTGNYQVEWKDSEALFEGLLFDCGRTFPDK